MPEKGKIQQAVEELASSIEWIVLLLKGKKWVTFLALLEAGIGYLIIDEFFKKEATIKPFLKNILENTGLLDWFQSLKAYHINYSSVLAVIFLILLALWRSYKRDTLCSLKFPLSVPHVHACEHVGTLYTTLKFL